MRTRLIVLSLCAMLVTGLAVACLSGQRQPVAPTPDIAGTVAAAVSEAMGTAVSEASVTPDDTERLASFNGEVSCARVLRSALLAQRGVNTVAGVNAMIANIQQQRTGLCSPGRWQPIVSSAPLADDGGCITREGDGNFGRVGLTNIPAAIGKTALNSDGGFTRDPDGNMLVLFDEAGTVDHGRCWVYLAAVDIWDAGDGVRASADPRRPTFAYVLPPTYIPLPTFTPPAAIGLVVPTVRPPAPIRITLEPLTVEVPTLELPALATIAPLEAVPFVPQPTLSYEEILESPYHWPAPQDPLPPVASLPPELAYIDEIPRPELAEGSVVAEREEYCADEVRFRLAAGKAGPQDLRFCYAAYNAMVAVSDSRYDGPWNAESCAVATQVFAQSLEHYLPGFMTAYEALLPWAYDCPLPDDIPGLIDADDYIVDGIPDVDFYRTPRFYDARGEACADALHHFEGAVLHDIGTTMRRTIQLCYLGAAGAWAYGVETSAGGNHADGCRESERVFRQVWDYHLPNAPEGAVVVVLDDLLGVLDCE